VYKAPGTRTSSGTSNKEAPPSALADVEAEGVVELDFLEAVDIVETEFATESNLNGVGRNKMCKMD